MSDIIWLIIQHTPLYGLLFSISLTDLFCFVTVFQNNSKYWPSIGEMATIGPFIVENQSTLKTSREITEVSLTLKSDDVYENTVIPFHCTCSPIDMVF